MFRKGQIEAFGLVIIVLLIVFIGLFFLIFMKGNDSDKNSYISAKAYNLANALYKSDVGGSSFKDLAGECCLNKGNECNILENFVRSNLNSVDEKSGFVMECGNGESINVGDCFLGLNSERFKDKEYEMYVIICGK